MVCQRRFAKHDLPKIGARGWSTISAFTGADNLVDLVDENDAVLLDRGYGLSTHLHSVSLSPSAVLVVTNTSPCHNLLYLWSQNAHRQFITLDT